MFSLGNVVFFLRFVLNKIYGMDVDRARAVEKFRRWVDSRCNVSMLFSEKQGIMVDYIGNLFR
jgi:hypothetical protein